jgi:hypothetical protein
MFWTRTKVEKTHQRSAGLVVPAIKWSLQGATPPLILLAPDAASPVARRVHSFESAAEAEEHIAFWFPPEHRRGLVAFWALSAEPEEESAEVVVLLRDGRDVGLAYVFSFLDAEGAMSFLRSEVRRGLCLTDAALYYGVPVSVETGVVSPRIPPVVRRAVPQAVPVEPAAEPEVADVAERVWSVLRVPRWSPPAGAAFQGFGSPPGRF